MPSNGMREYLVKGIDNLEKWQVIEMISGAPADILDKYEYFNSLQSVATLCFDSKA